MKVELTSEQAQLMLRVIDDRQNRRIRRRRGEEAELDVLRIALERQAVDHDRSEREKRLRRMVNEALPSGRQVSQLRAAVSGECVSRVYFVADEARRAIRFVVSSDPGFEDQFAARHPSGSQVVLLGSIPGDRMTEALIQRKFADFRMAGEWFAVAPEIVEFVTKEEVRADLRVRAQETPRAVTPNA